jgi:hypothetical protein
MRGGDSCFGSYGMDSAPFGTQITVKHVTVNADQAVVTDQIISTEAKESTAALLPSGTEKPMEILEPTHTEAVPVRTK